MTAAKSGTIYTKSSASNTNAAELAQLSDNALSNYGDVLPVTGGGRLLIFCDMSVTYFPASGSPVSSLNADITFEGNSKKATELNSDADLNRLIQASDYASYSMTAFNSWRQTHLTLADRARAIANVHEVLGKRIVVV